MEAPWKNTKIIHLCECIDESYYYYTSKRLTPTPLIGMQLSEYLYHASFVLVSHGDEEDPIFNYTNLKAQTLWELDWDKFTVMPSRLSAEPVEMEIRRQNIENGKKAGIISDFDGVRITSKGKRFKIENVVLWNVYDKSTFVGQAAMYQKYTFL